MPDAAEKPARPAFFYYFQYEKDGAVVFPLGTFVFLHPAFVFTVGRSEKSDAVKRCPFVK